MHRAAPVLAIASIALFAAACDRNGSRADIDITTAQTRAALAMSAFECSHLATAQADNSRLFALGVQAGRDFLEFADKNANGYRSLAPKLDPAWAQVESRPSVDFKLGELHAISEARSLEWRRNEGDSRWEAHREALYRQKNCQFLALPAAKG